MILASLANMRSLFSFIFSFFYFTDASATLGYRTQMQAELRLVELLDLNFDISNSNH